LPDQEDPQVPRVETGGTAIPAWQAPLEETEQTVRPVLLGPQAPMGKPDQTDLTALPDLQDATEETEL
jgi:hypothetical protein